MCLWVPRYVRLLVDPLSGPRGVLSDDMLTAMLTPQYQKDPFLPAQVTRPPTWPKNTEPWSKGGHMWIPSDF